MTAREATRAYHINQWTQIIRQCRGSGQTVKAWCEENDIDPKKYYYWLKCVREAAATALPATIQDSSIVPVELPVNHHDQSITSPQAVAAISCGTFSVQLSNEASYQMIENILKAMQHVR